MQWHERQRCQWRGGDQPLVSVLSEADLGIARPPGTGRRVVQSHAQSDNQWDVLVDRFHSSPCQGDSATSKTQERRSWLHSDVRGRKQAFEIITLKNNKQDHSSRKGVGTGHTHSICSSKARFTELFVRKSQKQRLQNAAASFGTHLAGRQRYDARAGERWPALCTKVYTNTELR